MRGLMLILLGLTYVVAIFLVATFATGYFGPTPRQIWTYFAAG